MPKIQGVDAEEVWELLSVVAPFATLESARNDLQIQLRSTPPPWQPPGAEAGFGAINVGERASVTVTEPPPAAPNDAGVWRPGLMDMGIVGEGGMGTVHHAFDLGLLRHSAVKVLQPEGAQDPHRRRRFLEEARITGQLEHPHIVPVYELSSAEDGSPKYFMMKLVRGQTLREKINERDLRKDDGSGLDALLAVFLKVCDAVAFAHSRGVVHRDLKPSNVMIGSHGQVYVMDWGIACVMRPAERPEELRDDQPVALGLDLPSVPRESGVIAGSPPYMSPEQALGRGAEIDEQTDVFLLGAMLYQVLTKQAPFRAPTAAECVRRAQRYDLRRPEDVVSADVPIPPELRRIMLRAMARSKSDRYPSVEALRQDVDRAMRRGLWFSRRDFLAGEVILQMGDPANCAYLIESGRCEAYRVEHGQKRSLRTMGPGEVFGETGVLTNQRRTATVAAIEPTRALLITRQALDREAYAAPWLSAIVRSLAERFTDVERQLRDEAK